MNFHLFCCYGLTFFALFEVTAANGEIMRHVSLKRGDETLKDGLVKLKLRRDGWYWEYFESRNWDRQSDGEKEIGFSSNSFELDEICVSVQREGNAVNFLAMVDGLDFTQPYTLTFADEKDAEIFTAKTCGRLFTDKVEELSSNLLGG